MSWCWTSCESDRETGASIQERDRGQYSSMDRSPENLPLQSMELSRGRQVFENVLHWYKSLNPPLEQSLRLIRHLLTPYQKVFHTVSTREHNHDEHGSLDVPPFWKELSYSFFSTSFGPDTLAPCWPQWYEYRLSGILKYVTLSMSMRRVTCCWDYMLL